MTIQEQGEAKLRMLSDAFGKLCVAIGTDKPVDQADVDTAFAAVDAAIIALEAAVPTAP